MKITTKDNFKSKIPKGTVDTGVVLKVPIMSLAGLGMPVSFELESEGLEIDTAEIQEFADEQLDSVMNDLASELKSALTKALMSPVWAWEGGSRDIFDTGRLAGSGQVLVVSGGLNVVYSAPYAGIVHDGGYIYPYGNTAARPVYLPGRPWIESVMYGKGPVPQFDFDGFFESKFG